MARLAWLLATGKGGRSSTHAYARHKGEAPRQPHTATVPVQASTAGAPKRATTNTVTKPAIGGRTVARRARLQPCPMEAGMASLRRDDSARQQLSGEKIRSSPRVLETLCSNPRGVLVLQED